MKEMSATAEAETMDDNSFDSTTNTTTLLSTDSTASEYINGTKLTLMQLYFLIVLVLAVTNVMLGIVYGCIQHRVAIHSQMCMFNDRRQSVGHGGTGDDSSNALRVKRPISANLVLNAGRKKLQVRQVPNVGAKAGAKSTK